MLICISIVGFNVCYNYFGFDCDNKKYTKSFSLVSTVALKRISSTNDVFSLIRAIVFHANKLRKIWFTFMLTVYIECVNYEEIRYWRTHAEAIEIIQMSQLHLDSFPFSKYERFSYSFDITYAYQTAQQSNILKIHYKQSLENTFRKNFKLFFSYFRMLFYSYSRK